MSQDSPQANPAAPGKLLLTLPEAARVLSLGQRKTWQMAKDGTLPTVRCGRALRFSYEGLRAWVAEQTAAAWQE